MQENSNNQKQPQTLEHNVSNRFSIVVKRDDEMDAFGAYLSPSIKQGEGIVLLNIEALISTALEHDASQKEVFVETLMHEVGHALEQWYDLEFNEDRIERIIESYRQKYGSPQ